MTADFPSLPSRPADYECCGRGCSPCIFDYYRRAMQRWRERVEALGGDPEAILTAAGWTPPPTGGAR